MPTDFEIQSVTTRTSIGRSLGQDRLPKTFSEQPKVRGRGRCEDFAGYDDSIFPSPAYYEIFSRPYDVTLVRMRIVNLGEALDDSYLEVDGASVIFTDGDFGGAPDPNSYPTDLFSLPAGGVFDLFCNQIIPAGIFLRLYTGTFVDEGVISSSLFAEFHYTFNCADDPP